MNTLKPSCGALLNPAHPLARNLIGCWCLNEAAGRVIHDVSPSRNAGALQGNTCFAPARFGAGLLCDGSGSYIALGGVKGTRATIAFWCKPADNMSVKGLYGYCQTGGGNRLDLDINNETVSWTGVYGWAVRWNLVATITLGRWCHICVQCGTGGAKLYINGRLAGSDPDEYCFDSWVANDHRIGWDLYAATDRYFTGTIDHVLMYNRTLSTAEVGQLYGEPFAMFRSSQRRCFPAVAGTTYRLLSGSVSATSGLSAQLRVQRRLAGIVTATASLTSAIHAVRTVRSVCAATAALSGRLSLAGIVPLAGTVQARTGARASLSVARERPPSEMDVETRTPWLQDVLFNGVTANAFHFGTALTRGWFWTRRSGCSALYRGHTPAGIDFRHAACVMDARAASITLPPHIHHRPGLPYCYVIRRFNSCGHIERTTSTAVQLHLDSDGKQCRPSPNPVSALTARLCDSRRVELSWLYHPVGQGAPPGTFLVFWNHGAGPIDIGHPLAVVTYKGATLHRYCSASLQEGEYRFAVQSLTNSGMSSSASPALSVQIAGAVCRTIQIIGAL